MACPAPVAEPLGRDQSTVGTDSGRCRGASRGPRTSRSRRTGRGVAAACWTVGGHRGHGPGTAGRTLPAPIRGRCAERPARAAWGPGMPGWAQRGPLRPAAAPASVGSWGGCRLAPEAGLGSEPMRLGCEGPGRAEAEPCPLGPASARPPSAPHRQVAAVSRGRGQPGRDPVFTKTPPQKQVSLRQTFS